MSSLRRKYTELATLAKAQTRGGIAATSVVIAQRTVRASDAPQAVPLEERRGRDLNPRHPCEVHTLSRRAPSTTRPPLRAPKSASFMQLSSGEVNSGPGKWRRIASLLALSAVICVVGFPLQATADGYADRVYERTLDNGLKLILLEDHKAPVATMQITYRIGSRNDLAGKTGRAHLLEHMMFKGTDTMGPEEYSQTVQRNGGTNNAFTSRDRTTYFVSIASDRLGVVLGLEADRMSNLVISEELYDPEKLVVMEERRMRVDNRPTGALFEQLYASAFQVHPYGQPIIGWMNDIRQSTAADLREFYRSFYAPNLAFIVAVGDFVASDLADEMETFFGGAQPRPMAPAVRAVEPTQQGERRVEVRREAQLPFVAMAHHVPNLRSADGAALEVLSQVLAGGKSSRLYRQLVYEKRVARYAGAEYDYSAIDPNLFILYAQPLPGQAPAAIEQLLIAEIDRLDQLPPSSLELQRAKNQIEAAYVFAQDSIYYQARLLGDFESAGDWRFIDRYLTELRAVTVEDLLRVCAVLPGAAQSHGRDARSDHGGPVRSSVPCILALVVALVSPAVAVGPAVVERTLTSGAELLVSEQRGLPVVIVVAILDAGSRRDPGGKLGLAHLTADTLTEGTAKRSATDIAEAIEFVGGSLSSGANVDYATVSLRVLRKDLDVGIDLFADVLLNPSFPEDELSRSRQSTLASLRSAEDNPTTVARRAFSRELYGQHPYAHPPEGTPESVAALDRASVRSFFEKHYGPQGAGLVVVGDIGVDEIQEKLDRALAGWRQRLRGSQLVAPTVVDVARRVQIDRPVTQASVVMGHSGVSRDNPDYEALTVLNYVLGGGGFSSRLVEKIRTEAGLVYSVSSYFSGGQLPGSFRVGMQTKNESVSQAVELARAEIVRISTDGVSEQELSDAVRYLTGSFPLSLDSNSEIASYLASTWFLGQGVDAADEYLRKISAVTRQDVRRVAAKYLQPEALLEVIVADLGKAGLDQVPRTPAPR